MPTESRIDAETAEQVMTLLELLAADAPVSQIASTEAPAGARDLALRITQAREVHQQREAGLAALLDTARELSTADDPGEVLDAIVRRAQRLLSTDLAYLTLYDAEAGDTFMRATDGSVSAAFQSVRLALGAGLGGLVASTRKPYWTADYWSDERFRHTSAIDGAVGEEGIVPSAAPPSSSSPTSSASSSPPTALAALHPRGGRPARQPRDAGRGDARADPRPLRRRAALAALSEAHETVRQYAAGIEKASAAHDRFASLVLDGGGVDDITHALAELLGGWAVLVDESGERRSASGPAPEPTESGKGPLDALNALPGLGSGRLVERDGLYAVAITAARERLGTIYVGGVGALGDSDQRTLERAGVVTALVMLFERQAADARQSARNRLVSDLVAARGSAEERTQLAADGGVRHATALLPARDSRRWSDRSSRAPHLGECRQRAGRPRRLPRRRRRRAGARRREQ